MNELNKKIESMLEHSLPIMPDHQVEQLTNDISKYIVEEIKEAYKAAWFSPMMYSDEEVENYLKSKYKI